MTQAKQQDKIQEIMTLIDGYAASDSISLRMLIESKLRELVREPLEGDDLSDVIMSFDGYITGDVVEFVEHVERAHGINSASGEV